MLRDYGRNVLEDRIATVPDVLKPYVKDGKIYYEKPLDLSMVIDEGYHGEIKFTKKGNWNHRILRVQVPNGTVVWEGKVEATNKATIHISNKEMHVVPCKERK